MTDIIEKDFAEFLTSNYLEYGKTVNESRAIPASDGLKPVHRRILMGLRSVADGKLTGSVNAVGAIQVLHPFGNCLRAGTRVFDMSGTYHKIEDLCNTGKSIETLSYDEKTNSIVASKAHSFRIGKTDNRVFKLLLSDGNYIECTHDHKFLVINKLNLHRKHTKTEWKTASELSVDDIIMSGEVSVDKVTQGNFRFSEYLHYLSNNEFKLDKHGHLKDDVTPDIHHKDENRYNNHTSNLLVVSRSTHMSIHGVDTIGSTHESMKVDPINKQRKSDRGSNVMKVINSHQSLLKCFKIIDMLDEKNIDQYNIMRSSGVIYNSPYYMTVSSKYSIETFEDLLELYDYFKKTSFYEVLNRLGVTIPEVSYSVDKENSLQHTSVCYNRGFNTADFQDSIRDMCWLFDNAETQALYDKYGYVGIVGIEILELDQEEKFFDFTVDGYENMIIPTSDFQPGEKFNYIIAHNSSIEAALSMMARTGVIDSHGAMGVKLIESIPAAAPRYTKSGLTKEQSRYWFNLLDYCPQVESDIGMEPEYLIAPVPYCLVYGSLNWGFGVMGRTPGFTYESLIEAYLRNDPSKLVPQYGYVCDYKTSDLEGLWNKGIGRLAMSYKCVRVDYNEILIYGSGEAFVPKFGLLDKWVEEGKIEIVNESTSDVAIRIKKTYRTHCDMDEVFEDCKRLSKFARTYTILMVQDGVVVQMPIKDWLDLTIGRFNEAFNKSKEDRINKVETEIEVLNHLPAVGRLLIEDKTDKQILKEVEGLSESILTKIKRKSISSLRKKDTAEEQKSLKAKIKSIALEKSEDELFKPM